VRLLFLATPDVCVRSSIIYCYVFVVDSCINVHNIISAAVIRVLVASTALFL